MYREMVHLGRPDKFYPKNPKFRCNHWLHRNPCFLEETRTSTSTRSCPTPNTTTQPRRIPKENGKSAEGEAGREEKEEVGDRENSAAGEEGAGAHQETASENGGEGRSKVIEVIHHAEKEDSEEAVIFEGDSQ